MIITLAGQFKQLLEKIRVTSTGFEAVTSGSYHLSYEATQFRSGHFVGLMCSHERIL